MTENENKINVEQSEKQITENKEPRIEIIKTANVKPSKIKYFMYFAACIFILVFSIYYTHIYAVKDIVKKITKNKEIVIYYNNQKKHKDLVPEMINYTKSWIINDKRVVKLIIDIMGVYVDTQNDINKEYNRQIFSVIKANELFKLVDLHPILKADKTYLELRKNFNNLYDKNMTAFSICKKLSSKLLQLTDTKIYKKYGEKIVNIDEIICKDER